MKKMLPSKWLRGSMATALAMVVMALAGSLHSTNVQADETCMSPYMAKIVGQEDYVYVWTLGVEGMGDEQDKLVTVSVNPNAKDYGEVVHTLSVGGPL